MEGLRDGIESINVCGVGEWTIFYKQLDGEMEYCRMEGRGWLEWSS
jgi:hypothetical protein